MDPLEDKNLTDDNAQASASTEESASNVTLEDVNIDEWLGMPGADSIVTAESDKEEEEDEKKTIFSSEKPSDMSFLEEDSSSEEITETDEAIAQLDDEIDNLQNATSDKDKKKVSSQMVRTFSKMIEEGTLMGFDDDKPLSEYEEQD